MARQETAWMKSPTGEVQEVPVDGTMGEFNQKIVAGWQLCDAPADTPAKPSEDSSEKIRN